MTEFCIASTVRYEVEVRGWDYRLYGPINLYLAAHKDTATANIGKTNLRIWTYNRQDNRCSDVAASPCHVGDSRYSTIQPTLLNLTSFTFIPTCVFAHRRLEFGDIYGQSINSVQYTFPFHGRVYQPYQYGLKF